MAKSTHTQGEDDEDSGGGVCYVTAWNSNYNEIYVEISDWVGMREKDTHKAIEANEREREKVQSEPKRV